MNNLLDRDDLSKLSIDDLRSLKVDLHWVLKEKESADRITVYAVEEYEGITRMYLNFESALQYVLDNIEVCYRKGLDRFNEEGRPSYITLSGFAPRIQTRLYLPSEIEAEDAWFLVDKNLFINNEVL